MAWPSRARNCFPPASKTAIFIMLLQLRFTAAPAFGSRCHPGEPARDARPTAGLAAGPPPGGGEIGSPPPPPSHTSAGQVDELNPPPATPVNRRRTSRAGQAAGTPFAN